MTHGLSFDIEEHFQVAAFDSVVRRRHWESFESRVERNTQVLLELLEERGVKATMFIVGWVAERHKSLVRTLAEAGHEIACHSYAHELIGVQTPQQFREDVRRTKQLLEDLTGQPVWGYRAPTFSITKETEWALAILVEEGYKYDSSIVPIVHDFYGIPGANPYIHVHQTPSGEIWEVPPSTCRAWGLSIPVAGGGYFRLFPYSIFHRLLKRVEGSGHPLIMYFHPWEFDPDQPRMRGSALSRFRHYHNLDKTKERLSRLLDDFSFGPIASLVPMVAEPSVPCTESLSLTS
ncbi:MAG: DUF3473 domain-containing protein [Nitrospirae bacterium]|nr:MAG: DUF3473 domain-containing protein [Nitrospirota bacterium]